MLLKTSAWSQLVPGSMDAHWDEGAKDCKASPQLPIEVHSYNQETFILRESLLDSGEKSGASGPDGGLEIRMRVCLRDSIVRL
ncbi:MAG TPA: hypothetical protein VI455_11395 [Terriglobia bacterium]